MRSTVALAAALLVLACSHPVEPPTPRPVSDLEAGEVERTLTLRVGATGTVDGLAITFRGVESDSRCPADALCVWVGDGAVRLSLEVDEHRAGTTLHTHLAPKAVEYAGYTVRLAGLTPYPYASAPIAPGQYMVTLGVRR
jgi:hypothetical protein